MRKLRWKSPTFLLSVSALPALLFLAACEAQSSQDPHDKNESAVLASQGHDGGSARAGLGEGADPPNVVPFADQVQQEVDRIISSQAPVVDRVLRKIDSRLVLDQAILTTYIAKLVALRVDADSDASVVKQRRQIALLKKWMSEISSLRRELYLEWERHQLRHDVTGSSRRYDAIRKRIAGRALEIEAGLSKLAAQAGLPESGEKNDDEREPGRESGELRIKPRRVDLAKGPPRLVDDVTGEPLLWYAVVDGKLYVADRPGYAEDGARLERVDTPVEYELVRREALRARDVRVRADRIAEAERHAESRHGPKREGKLPEEVLFEKLSDLKFFNGKGVPILWFVESDNGLVQVYRKPGYDEKGAALELVDTAEERETVRDAVKRRLVLVAAERERERARDAAAEKRREKESESKLRELRARDRRQREQDLKLAAKRRSQMRKVVARISSFQSVDPEFAKSWALPGIIEWLERGFDVTVLRAEESGATWPVHQLSIEISLSVVETSRRSIPAGASSREYVTTRGSMTLRLVPSESSVREERRSFVGKLVLPADIYDQLSVRSVRRKLLGAILDGVPGPVSGSGLLPVRK